ncbi:MAG: hypothetical protein M0Q91_14350 [Methanoregula sp.]|nr:hypothetical protein [Methanoregula sp.]
MNVTKKQILLGVFLLLYLLCGFGSALTIYQNESQIIQTSDLIVYGKIVNVKSAWNTQNTHIETTAEVLVNDTLKNSSASIISPGSTIFVTVLGGAVGNISEQVEDTPVLTANTEMIFFLKKISIDSYSVMNLYGVINGKIGESTSSSTPNNVAAFKQKIAAIGQGNTSGPTTTTQKSGIVYAPVMAIISILFLFRKTGRP